MVGEVPHQAKPNYEASEIKSRAPMCRKVGQSNRMENPETDSSMCENLIYDKDVISNHCYQD